MTYGSISRPSKTLAFVTSTALACALFAFTAEAEVPTDPPTFSDPLTFTNSYAPFVPGGTKVYRGKGDEALVVVDKYLDEVRTFDLDGEDVDTWVLEEVEFEDGELVEISRNFFAQGDDGAVYYFGETVDIYEDEQVVDHDGSWLVGGATELSDPIDTANASAPALFMPANPEVGDVYKPEDLFPFVDESDEVKHTNVKIIVPGGKFKHCIKVKETSALDPGESERKWWAPGVGVVLVREEGETLKLVASTLFAE